MLIAKGKIASMQTASIASVSIFLCLLELTSYKKEMVAKQIKFNRSNQT
jgi:hypothetical protein